MFRCIEARTAEKRAIDADHSIATHGQFAGLSFQMAHRFGQIDVGAFVIEMDTHIRITLRRLNDPRR